MKYLVNKRADPEQIASVQATNVVIGGRQTNIIDGQPIELPSLEDLVVYLANVRNSYSHWADASTQDRFIETRALPMRLAQYSPRPTENEAPTVELLTAVQDDARTIILGERVPARARRWSGWPGSQRQARYNGLKRGLKHPM